MNSLGLREKFDISNSFLPHLRSHLNDSPLQVSKFCCPTTTFFVTVDIREFHELADPVLRRSFLPEHRHGPKKTEKNHLGSANYVLSKGLIWLTTCTDRTEKPHWPHFKNSVSLLLDLPISMCPPPIKTRSLPANPCTQLKLLFIRIAQTGSQHFSDHHGMATTGVIFCFPFPCLKHIYRNSLTHGICNIYIYI